MTKLKDVPADKFKELPHPDTVLQLLCVCLHDVVMHATKTHNITILRKLAGVDAAGLQLTRFISHIFRQHPEAYKSAVLAEAAFIGALRALGDSPTAEQMVDAWAAMCVAEGITPTEAEKAVRLREALGGKAH